MIKFNFVTLGTLGLFALFLVPIIAQGVPTDFMLVAPDSIRRIPDNDKEVEITFKAPCKNLAFDQLLTSSDDSNKTIVVGFVYPASKCNNLSFMVIHNRTVTRDWPEWETLNTPNSELKPMTVKK